MAILGRHEARFKKADPEALRAMASDATTPPDLKRALDELLRKPGLQKAVMPGGTLNAKGINDAQKHMPGQRAYAEAKAREYTQNYVPSDAPEGQAGPRPMTSNDAMRELFKYSDELPKKVSREALRDIANGTAGAGKCPPQLQAAAQFYVDNPAAWQRDFGCDPEKSLRKDKLLNRSDDKIQLTQKEHDTLNTLSTHRDVFFGGKSLTPETLKKQANDDQADPQVREAARELLGNKMLFAMLDNGKHQHGGNLIHPANDKKIGEGDLNAWLSKMNKTVASAHTAATSPADFSLSATRDMLEGQFNQPDFKHKKGGGLADFGAGLLKGVGFVAGLASGALGAVANLRIPGVSWLAGAGAVGLSMAEGGAKVGATAIEGGDVKAQGIAAGIGTAATLAGLVGGKGASQAAKQGLEGAAEQGRKGAQRWSQKAVTADTDVTRGETVAAAAKGMAERLAAGAVVSGGMQVMDSGGSRSDAPVGGALARRQVDAQLQGIAASYGRI
ncbi:HrpF/NolX family T3SS translocon protein [Roseateles amylovorans]|uniref:HrpF/NolX family T3SS translocon protein n=1 Tax=Roseateles amylovorans TaxID=2978473 RepID=A0ABY6B2Y6_9BURK|nr:HrpF/NolX family T3SS translocon protein [Roseateles amylovorans]UXH79074.1 HrpF/NolX family T3SS translocon protein [Roseateles amylovorans]